MNGHLPNTLTRLSPIAVTDTVCLAASKGDHGTESTQYKPVDNYRDDSDLQLEGPESWPAARPVSAERPGGYQAAAGVTVEHAAV